jgi:hypothetical protein
MSASRPTALVTGASSGIGLELARVLAREGHDLVLTARREPKLEEVAAELASRFGTTSKVITSDLSRADGPKKLYDAVQDAGIEVDVLVNNAGLGNHGRIWETPVAGDEGQLAVNVVALTTLTKLFLPAMVARGRGRVLNVASTAGFQPGPFMAVYYATKAYVLSFTEAVAEELVGTGVTATALCPGVVPTEFQTAAKMDDNLPMLKAPGAKSAEFVAIAAYDGMSKGRRIVIPGVMNKFAAQGNRLLPRGVIVKIAKQLHPPG